MSSFTYAEVGATKPGGQLPSGYRYLHRRMRVGSGKTALGIAARAVLEWRMHAGMHVRPEADGPRAEQGTHVTLHLGPRRLCFTAPCEVVWTIDEPARKGFAYGTLSGHPERGEEAFLVEMDVGGDVWLTITAFSAGATWYTKAAGPLVPVLQNLYALCCGAVVRRMVHDRSAEPTSAPVQPPR